MCLSSELQLSRHCLCIHYLVHNRQNIWLSVISSIRTDSEVDLVRKVIVLVCRRESEDSILRRKREVCEDRFWNRHVFLHLSGVSTRSLDMAAQETSVFHQRERMVVCGVSERAGRLSSGGNAKFAEHACLAPSQCPPRSRFLHHPSTPTGALEGEDAHLVMSLDGHPKSSRLVGQARSEQAFIVLCPQRRDEA